MEERENLDPSQLQILEEIEETIAKPLECIEDIGMDSLGVKITGKNIVGMGLFGIDLLNIPEPLFKLNYLEEFPQSALHCGY